MRRMSFRKAVYLLLASAIAYHALVVAYLFQANAWVLVAYYTAPPWKTGEGFVELPPIFKGDELSLFILKHYKQSEISELVKQKQINLHSVLSSEEHMTHFTENEAIKRNINIARLVVSAGADIYECHSNLTIQQYLKKYNLLLPLKKDFLNELHYSDKGC